MRLWKQEAHQEASSPDVPNRPLKKQIACLHPGLINVGKVCSQSIFNYIVKYLACICWLPLGTLEGA